MSGKGKAMCAAWVRDKLKELADTIDAEHSDVMVGSLALLGPGGFNVEATEEAMNIDPTQYGPMMLEGHSLIAASSLEAVLSSLHAAVQSELHYTQDIETEEERLAELRALFEQVFRQWLHSVITYAGERFQQAHAPDPALVAGSQVLGKWREVATRPIRLSPMKEADDGK